MTTVTQTTRIASLCLFLLACSNGTLTKTGGDPGHIPANVENTVTSLAQGNTASAIGFVTRYFVPTGIVVRPSEVEARISEKPSLCNALIGRDNFYNRLGDGSEVHSVRARIEGGQCKARLTLVNAASKTSRMTTIAPSPKHDAVANQLVVDQGGDILVRVYVDEQGNLVEARFYEDQRWNLLHGNTGPNGKRLSLFYVYSFSLGIGAASH